MSTFTEVEKNLKARGYEVTTVANGVEAATYLNKTLDGVTIGIGGSATVKSILAYERLKTHNTVFWHWEQTADEARANAMTTDIYLTSANALAETGEIVNIDGLGNRVSSTLFGHKKIIFLIGKNKLMPNYDAAVSRARNVAAPKRARQIGVKTPCVLQDEKCYDCKSPERICRGMVTSWGPMMGMKAEVILINEDFGL